MTRTPGRTRLLSQLADMIAIETVIKQRVEELIPDVAGHATASRLIAEFRTLSSDHRQALEKDQKQTPKQKYDDFPTIMKYLANAEPNFRSLVDGNRVIHRNDSRLNRAARLNRRVARAPMLAGRV